MNYKKGSLILLSGIPGSGKSSFCKKYFGDKQNYIISSDEIRERYFGQTNDFDNEGNIVLSNNNCVSPLVFDIMKNIAKERLKNGLTTVIDAMNLDDNSRNEFIKLGNWKEIYTIVFDIDINDAIKNNERRKENGGRYVDSSIIKSKYEKFQLNTNITGNNIINSNSINEFIEINNEIILNKDTKYIFLGDSHGFDGFINEIEKILIDNKDGNFKIIILGDIIDRGEKSIENLLYLYEKQRENNLKDKFIFIKGNHEEKLLRNLKTFDKDKNIKDINIASYKSFYDLINIFNNGYNGENSVLKGKKYNLKQIINFLEGFEDYIILKNEYNLSKIIISHGPFLPPNNLGEILKEDCIYGMSKFRLKTGNKLDINFIKALDYYGKKNNCIFINGHFDYSNILNEYYSGNKDKTNIKRIYSIEGRVDTGGEFVILEYTYDKGFEEKRIKSNLNYSQQNKVINDKNYFDKLVKEGIITGNKSHNEYQTIQIYKYGRQVFYNNLWNSYDKKTNKILKLSRGIVLDNYGNLISYPFGKTFNYGEKIGENDNKLKEGEYEFIEKFNGFLGIISQDPYNKGKLLIHTQGSLDQNFKFNSYIKELLTKEQETNLIKFFNKNGKFTFMFEVIHPNDPHIVKYEGDDYGLKLIGCRDINSNNIYNSILLTESELDIIGESLGFKRPFHFVDKLSNVLNDCKIKTNLEGYMVRDLISKDFLVKIKTTFYLLSKFLGRMSDGNYKFLFTNKENFIKSKGIEEEFYPLIDFIYNNKNQFINKNKEERVMYITNFINNKLNTIGINKQDGKCF